jgi:hypothetical protein
MLVSVIVLVGFTFAYIFKTAGFAAQLPNLPSQFAGTWATQYKVLFGDFEDLPINNVFDWTLFFFLTLVCPLVTLNLLIAIISVAHGKIVENEKCSDNAQLNGIILEIETFMVCKRCKHNKEKNNQRHHLIYAEYNKSDDTIKVRPEEIV